VVLFVGLGIGLGLTALVIVGLIAVWLYKRRLQAFNAGYQPINSDT
jgi:hypothetical protein